MGNNHERKNENVKKITREIRNRKSPKEVKPRVFDVCYYPEMDKTYLEVKGANKQIERIDFDDVIAQIKEAKSEYVATK